MLGEQLFLTFTGGLMFKCEMSNIAEVQSSLNESILASKINRVLENIVFLTVQFLHNLIF